MLVKWAVTRKAEIPNDERTISLRAHLRHKHIAGEQPVGTDGPRSQGRPNVTSASNASVQGSPPLRKLCNLFETLRIAEVQMEVEASGLVWHMAYV